MNKSIIYLINFTLYSIILLFFGKGGFKRTKNTRDFFIAVNSLGLSASIFTFSATWFSAASMQGLTGSVYAYGYSIILYAVVPWFVGATFLVLLATRLKNYDIITVPQYFKIRYDSKWLQAMGGFVIVITYILYMIIQVRGFGIVISEFLDINYTFAIVLVYLFVIYTTFGGLFSVAKTDAFNFILIITGTILAAMLVLKGVNGLAFMHHEAIVVNTRPFPSFPHVTAKGALLDPFSKGALPPFFIFASFFGWGLGLATNPQYAIRITSAKDKGTAIKMICYSVLILAFLYLGLIIIGIGGRVLIPTIDSIYSVDEVFPYLINNVIYSPFSGIILISIMAAAISTANSQLLVAASGFSFDIYKNLINPNVEDDKLLTMNRIFIFVAGTISLVMSLNPPASLLIYGGYIWGVFSVTFLLPLYGGLFWEKATKEGAIWSFIGGLIILIVFMVRNHVFFSTSDTLIHPALPGVVGATAIFYTVSRYFYYTSKE
ncbi:sodium:solute symporter family protein [Natronincola ferrireducens]|uniref:Solute:Na+ symporter, SSS family n=1 Tax=Natronincola ferrireducens TaxID=393762 RepID=A0A1G9E8A5_9FIRM|nr:sodium:solute symporter family protein [Natronincola ferrireducens]SDK72369.1 solute:Na+ symporter, SSS family [Natronincola ferrireducens]